MTRLLPKEVFEAKAVPADLDPVRPREAERPSRRRRTAMLAGCAVVAAGLLIWSQWPVDAAGGALASAPVELGTVETSVLATGLLKPTNLVAVGAQVSGRIETLAVGVGDTVEPGDLIAEIDPVPRQNALRIAQANLAQVEAELEETRATLAQQRRVLERRQRIGSSAVTQADIESAEADVAVSEARVHALEAGIQSAKVAVEDAEVNLGYTRITAPSAGTVLAVVAQQGQTVNATQTTPTIVVMGALDTMSIEAGISEADVVRVVPGQDVWFTILGEPATRHEATLTAIAPAPASITKDTALTGETSDAVSTTSSEAIYYNGLFAVPNEDGKLRTYMTAEVHVVLDRATNVLTIPSSALGEKGLDGSRAVTVIKDDGSTEQRWVKVGLDNRAIAEIRSGLVAGERVVTGSVGAAETTERSPGPRMPPMGL